MSVFGEVCDLLAASQTYGHWRFDKVVHTFLVPIAKEQALVYRRNGRLVGIITFAYVSDEALSDLVELGQANLATF